ncbi:hypothetical protein GQ602_001405 [Ophiocordyceps camponoti-floridani]|uniref:Uncharacterized protein n=1 Tax=Ophiocordyceps camponoti-floridani TaxID=2030778 RepID=A0A8H4QE37_9HYPO|nr:hypothetical protein GQ602_001405 [Ophiocordyceps camponoti-floridani]
MAPKTAVYYEGDWEISYWTIGRKESHALDIMACATGAFSDTTYIKGKKRRGHKGAGPRRRRVLTWVKKKKEKS